MDVSPLGLDDQPHELKIGSSFSTKDQTFHSIRYDFKPASMDPNQMATVDVGKRNEMTVSVPHVEGAGTSHTVFKGNKRPGQKDCVLIIDHETGEIKLEKLSYMMQLKKTRSVPAPNRGQQINRPSTPVEQPTITKPKDVKTSPGKTKIASKPTSMAAQSKPSPAHSRPSPSSQESPAPTPDTKRVEAASVGIMTSSSGSESSDSSDSDSESEKPPAKIVKHNPDTNVNTNVNTSGQSKHFMSTLCEDLQLSDSGSDSD